MNILIVEDEIKTGRALISMIDTVRPGCTIAGPLQRISSTVEYLRSHPAPDVIFMDIQLADGMSFKIFEKTTVNSPVVFCTAFDEYALDAFKANGVDYILKPFSADAIRAAFDKLDRIGKVFGNDHVPAEMIKQLLNAHQPKASKQSFLVFNKGKYVTVPVGDVAYIYIRNEQTTLVTFDQHSFVIDQSLEETTEQLDGKDFFKLNRQYLLSFKAIKEVEHYFGRKLLIKLTIPTDDKLLVGKDKTTAFLHWLDNR